MKIPTLWSGYDYPATPFKSLHSEMDDFLKRFGMPFPSLDIGAKAPAVDVSEAAKAIEITVELPGVEEKDVSVRAEGNRLVISGEKKHESKRDEKDWHVEERSFGSFYRSMSLPFIPGDGAIQAHLDKGVLHVTVNKPTDAVKETKTIPIKTGSPV